MKRFARQVFLILLLGYPAFLFSQSCLDRGLIAFEVGDFEEAIPLLEKAIQKKGDFRAICPLAMSYQNMGLDQEAVAAFNLASTTRQMSDTAYLAYASALLDAGEYIKASNLLMEERLRLENFQGYGSLLDKAMRCMTLISDSVRFELIKVEIPADGSKICPFYHENGLVFTSSLEPNDKKPSRQQYSVFHSDRKNMFSFESPKRLVGFKKSKYSEGPVTISSKLTRYYFSRVFEKFPDPQNRIQNGSVSRILSTEFRGKKWEEPGDLNFNSWQFSNTQPTLSRDDSVMVFCSNRPGGEDLVERRFCDGLLLQSTWRRRGY